MPHSSGNIGGGGGADGLLICLLCCFLSIFLESMYVPLQQYSVTYCQYLCDKLVKVVGFFTFSHYETIEL